MPRHNPDIDALWSVVDGYMSSWPNASTPAGGIWSHPAGPDDVAVVLVDVDAMGPLTAIRVGLYLDPSVDNDAEVMLFATDRDQLHRAFTALLTYADPIPEE